ncbi:hypothetical protein CHISP_3546 [Chitinispirillum alkaliphilum]|nr:hypothetical protein CHISP_3546 [Chitinispirillum alkaliphilum]
MNSGERKFHKRAQNVVSIVIFLISMIFATDNTSESYTTVDSSNKSTGLFERLLSSEEPPFTDIEREAFLDVLKGHRGLTSSRTSSVYEQKHVKIIEFTTIPQIDMPIHKDAAFKGVLEHARLKIATLYEAIMDTSNLHLFHGDITLEILLNKEGRVKTCKIQGSSVRVPDVNNSLIDFVEQLDFEPVWYDKRINGMTVKFSFRP